jgi:hypothetical protein
MIFITSPVCEMGSRYNQSIGIQVPKSDGSALPETGRLGGFQVRHGGSSQGLSRAGLKAWKPLIRNYIPERGGMLGEPDRQATDDIGNRTNQAAAVLSLSEILIDINDLGRFTRVGSQNGLLASRILEARGVTSAS